MRVLCCETCGLMALRLASIMEAAAEAVQHLRRYGCPPERFYIDEVRP